MSKFPSTSIILMIISIITILSHGQYYKNVGNQSIDCYLSNCTLECGGPMTYSCGGAIINAQNSNIFVSCQYAYSCEWITIYAQNSTVYVNCSGPIYACRGMTIYAAEANSLIVNAITANAYKNVADSIIVCPRNNDCNITAHGSYGVLQDSIINGTLASKLFIVASAGMHAMYNSTIYCPSDYEPGPKYSNNAVCDIYVGGSYPMVYVKIYANEG
eukprot:495535_1